MNAAATLSCAKITSPGVLVMCVCVTSSPLTIARPVSITGPLVPLLASRFKPLRVVLSESNSRTALLKCAIVPLVMVVLQEAGGAIAPESLALAFGLVMYEAQPDVLELVLLTLPEEIRPALKSAAQQAFAAHSQAVHGTATPRRSTELSR